MDTSLQLVKGDIAQEDVDAIVNAANEQLTGGGGVDGAIHRAAGPKLLEECMALPERGGVRCGVGQARMTGSYELPAKYVIHTVAPTWPAGEEDRENEEKTSELALRSCYFSCMTFAWLQGLRSIAFPCIGTGAFCFPKDRAADVALFATNWFVKNHDTDLEAVRFVCFGDEDYEAYQAAAPNHGLSFQQGKE